MIEPIKEIRKMHDTANPYPNVPFPAGAVKVHDWHDTQYGIDHAGRYFRGFTRVVERDTDEDISVLVDGIQRPAVASTAASRSLMATPMPSVRSRRAWRVRSRQPWSLPPTRSSPRSRSNGTGSHDDRRR
jgi:hypothetical protein